MLLILVSTGSAVGRGRSVTVSEYVILVPVDGRKTEESTRG